MNMRSVSSHIMKISHKINFEDNNEKYRDFIIDMGSASIIFKLNS
jgi:hypothetical protein